MKAEVPLSPQARALLQEATAWRLLGLLFEEPGEGWAREAASLAATLPGEEVLCRAAARAREEGSPVLYQSLLGPGGPVTPRETSHRPELLPGPLLAEISAYYDQFAYHPALREPPDHVAMECGFLGYLRLKEAFARESGFEKQVRTVADAFGHFREDHLREMAEPFAASLEPLGVEYLRLASRELLRRTGSKPPRPTTLPAGGGEACPFQK
ncbi:MAG: molecular chaperone TorD family protein [Acidobacteriota bacterium]